MAVEARAHGLYFAGFDGNAEVALGSQHDLDSRRKEDCKLTPRSTAKKDR